MKLARRALRRNQFYRPPCWKNYTVTIEAFNAMGGSGSLRTVFTRRLTSPCKGLSQRKALRNRYDPDNVACHLGRTVGEWLRHQRLPPEGRRHCLFRFCHVSHMFSST